MDGWNDELTDSANIKSELKDSHLASGQGDTGCLRKSLTLLLGHPVYDCGVQADRPFSLLLGNTVGWRT